MCSMITAQTANLASNQPLRIKVAHMPYKYLKTVMGYRMVDICGRQFFMLSECNLYDNSCNTTFDKRKPNCFSVKLCYEKESLNSNGKKFNKY